MKVLFVSMVAFEQKTSATIQNKGLVKGLYALGHQVDTLTLSPCRDAVQYDASMNDIKELIGQAFYFEASRSYAKLMARKPSSEPQSRTGGRKKKRARSLVRKSKAAIKRLLDRISVFDGQKINVKEVTKTRIDYGQYDLILSASDPKSSHLIVRRILKDNPLCQARWIQYWGDPMHHDITRKKVFCDKRVRRNEEKLIEQADRVVYASPLTLNQQKVTYPFYAAKMDYASQPYVDPGDLPLASDAKDGRTERVDIGYYGAYQSNVRNILPLYQAVRDSQLSMHIVGASDLELAQTKRIMISKSLPYGQVQAMEQRTDILACLCNLRGTQIPGKIYYVSGYSKPVMVILDGEFEEELKAFLGDFGRYILCANNEGAIKQALAEAIRQLEKGQDYLMDQRLSPEYFARKVLG